MTTTAPAPESPQISEAGHFDVLIVGAASPGSAPRTTSGTGSPTGPSSSSTPRTTAAAPGGPTATRVSAPTATCSPTATASSRGAARRSRPARRSSTTSTRSSRRTTSARTSATTTASPPRAGRARTAAGPSRSPAPTPASGCASPPTSCGCARATTTTTKPYRPALAGHGRLPGRARAPAEWPDDLDLAGKRVVVIGSGATAATLIPAIAKDAEHVTMLQRSPTYYLSRPTNHELATTLRALDIPDEWTHEILRRQYMVQTNWLARMSLEAPDEVHAFLMDGMRPLLPEGIDVAKHFTPRYRPWQQRIAARPGRRPVRRAPRGQRPDRHRHHRHVHPARHPGGLGRGDPGRRRRHRHGLQPVGLRRHRVHRRRRAGRLRRARHLARHDDQRRAEHGLHVRLLPAQLDPAHRPRRRLRAPAVRDHAGEGRRRGDVPTLRPTEADMPKRAWSDPENFNAGYVLRSQHLLYKQGDREPWTHMMDTTRSARCCPRPTSTTARSATAERHDVEVSSTVAEGRAAFARAAWADACALLASATEVEDLERLAVAAHLAGRDDASVQAWTRAHRGTCASATPAGGPVRVLAGPRCCLLRGETARAGGWLARAERLVDAGGRRRRRAAGSCGFPRSSSALGGGDGAAAAALADEIVDSRRSGAATRTCWRWGCWARARRRSRWAMLGRGDDAARRGHGAGHRDGGLADPRRDRLLRGDRGVRRRRRPAPGGRVDRGPGAAGARPSPTWCPTAASASCTGRRCSRPTAAGRTRSARCERARRRLSDPPHPALGLALYQRGELHRLRGELDAAEQAYRAASRHGRGARPGLRVAAAGAGRRPGGGRRDRGGCVEESRGRLERPVLLAAAVEVLLAAGDIEPPPRRSRELGRLAESPARRRCCGPSPTTRRGCVLLATGAPDRRCRRCARRPCGGARSGALRRRAGRGAGGARLPGAGRPRRRRARARRGARRVRALGAAPDLARRDRAGARRRTVGRTGLTARECEVLRLVADRADEPRDRGRARDQRAHRRPAPAEHLRRSSTCPRGRPPPPTPTSTTWSDDCVATHHTPPVADGDRRCAPMPPVTSPPAVRRRADRPCRPRTLDPATVERLSTAFNRCFETLDAGEDLFTADAFFDLLPPFWRFQLQGPGRLRRAAAGARRGRPVERPGPARRADRDGLRPGARGDQRVRDRGGPPAVALRGARRPDQRGARLLQRRLGRRAARPARRRGPDAADLTEDR